MKKPAPSRAPPRATPPAAMPHPAPEPREPSASTTTGRDYPLRMPPYPPDAMKWLAQRYGIDLHQHGKALADALSSAAFAYAAFSGDLPRALSVDGRRRVRLVETSARKLFGALADLTPDERALLWERSVFAAPGNPFHAHVATFHDLPLEHAGDERRGDAAAAAERFTIYTPWNDELLCKGVSLVAGNAQAVLSGDRLRAAASPLRGKAPKPAGERLSSGRPSRLDLAVWLGPMRGFWTNTLHRKFTFDSYMGKAASPAFAFCWDALRLLDPKASEKTLGGVIRKQVAIHARPPAQK